MLPENGLRDQTQRKLDSVEDSADGKDKTTQVDLQYRIFVSHKHENKQIANTIKETLESLSAKVDVYVSSQDIEFGSNWNNDLRKRLAQADMLLFLYTEPTATWDWCLYECGIFTPLLEGQEGGRRKPRPIVCLHYERGQPPAPLAHLRPVRATPTEVHKFLRDLFSDNKITKWIEPLDDNYKRRRKNYNHAAETISAALTPAPAGEELLVNYMELRVASDAFDQDGKLANDDGIPPNTMIKSNSFTMGLFGMTDRAPNGKNWMWADLREDDLKPDEARCLDEVDIAFRELCTGRLLPPIKSVFRSRSNEKLYRPVFLRRDSAADGSSVFQLLLVEQPESRDANGAQHNPGEQAVLKMLEVGRHFHTKFVVEFFDDFLKIGPNANDEVKEKLIEDITKMIKEAKEVFVFDKEFVVSQFDRDQREKVGKLYDSWQEIDERLLEAFREWNLTRIKDEMENLRQLNIESMGVALATYQRLLSGVAGLHSSDN